MSTMDLRVTARDKARRVEQLSRRLAYVQACSDCRFNRASMKLAISQVAQHRNEFPPPAIVTVMRWIDGWRKRGTAGCFSIPVSHKTSQRISKNRRIYEE